MSKGMADANQDINSLLEAYVAGRAEAVGRDAKQFQPGDEVFGGSGLGSVGCALVLKLTYVCADVSH